MQSKNTAESKLEKINKNQKMVCICESYTVFFEYNTGKISDEKLQNCYEWGDQLVIQGGQE